MPPETNWNTSFCGEILTTMRSISEHFLSFWGVLANWPETSKKWRLRRCKSAQWLSGWQYFTRDGARDMPILGTSFAEEDNPANSTNGLRQSGNCKTIPRQNTVHAEHTQRYLRVVKVNMSHVKEFSIPTERLLEHN